MDARDRAIEKAAEDVLRKGRGYFGPYGDVNVFDIAEDMGFAVLYGYDKIPAGILLSPQLVSKYGTDKLIFVRRETARSIREAVAHALGHYVLHVGDEYKRGGKDFAYIERDDPYLKAEHEADVFAGALLMPRKWVMPFASSKTEQRAEETADRFLVTVGAARVRLSRLGLAV